MAKKKICSWLDSNIKGGIQILNDGIYPCCGTAEPMIYEDGLDYNKITMKDIQNGRLKVYELMNKNEACMGCDQIVEKDENDIDIGKIQILSAGLFSTCNLRCKYCYFTHEQLGAQLSPKRTKLLPLVKKFADADLLKETVELRVAGGEPTLFEDLPETLNFLAEKYSSPSFVLLSNSTIDKKAKILAENLKNVNKKINKTLYTSIDAGTPETYKIVRGKDLFNSACKNIIKYAKKGTFNNINLKYILLFDHSNTSDKDIFGFLKFAQKVVLNNKNGGSTMTIDCDMLSKEPFDEEMVAAAGKLYYVTNKILGMNIYYCGGALAHSNKTGSKRIAQLEKYASDYPKMTKSFKENLYLTEFRIAAVIKTINNSLNYKKIMRILRLLKILHT